MSSTSLNQSQPRYTEHPEFFFDDEMVIFLVEDCYYKLHRYFLRRDSEVFRGLFMCPPGESEPEGTTKETAIPLPGVTKFEMTCLCRFLYHGMYHSISWKTTVPEWTALLSISTRYSFDRVRDRAILALAPSSFAPSLLNPVDRIVLAVKHDVSQWLESAYVQICMRDEPLNEEEGEKLGMSIVVRMAEVRERYWREQAAAHPHDDNEDDNADLRYWAQAGAALQFNASCDPKRARATQVVREVFWPPSTDQSS